MTRSKVYKAVIAERDRLKKVMMAPYQKHINYVQVMDELRYYADSGHHICLNRSFINLGLNNQ